MKKVLALMAVVAMIAVSSVAYAQQDIAVTAGVSSSLTFSNDCTNAIALGTLAANDGAEGTCTFTAFTNNTTGSEATWQDSNPGLASGTDTWTKLVGTGTGAMDTTCSASCTEAWGTKLENVVVHNVLLDNDLSTPADFDAADPTYHDAPTTAETVIDNAGPVDTTGSFDLNVGAVTSDTTPTGTYSGQISVNYVETP